VDWIHVAQDGDRWQDQHTNGLSISVKDGEFID
jgi:hypothetical protein